MIRLFPEKKARPYRTGLLPLLETVADLTIYLQATLVGAVGMQAMQIILAGEAVAVATALVPSIIAERRMAGRTVGGQGPVGDPHFRVGCVGVAQPAGRTVAIRPAARRGMGIVESASRAAVEGGMTVGRRTGHIATPQGMFACRVTAHAVAATGRDAGLQIRDGRMAQATIAIMGDIDRFIGGAARIVTAGAAGPVVLLYTADSHISGSEMGCVRHRLV